MNMLNRMTTVAALLVGTTSLMAQESVGTVLGSVSSQKGQALAGATVTLTSPALLGGRTATTDAQGHFRMPLLPPGEYRMLVTKAQFVGSSAIFRISGGQTLRQDLKLREIEVQAAVVEITAGAATVDKTDAKTATTLTASTMADLPITLSAQGALTMSPGVSGTSDYPSVRGGVAGSTQFMVNGVSVRDNVMRYGRQTSFVIADLTEEVQVLQSPLNAKYGFASSGSVNLLTKSGTNEFSGSVRLTTDRNTWSSLSVPVVARRFETNGTNYSQGNVLGTDALNRSYQVTVTGPIVKDKLTFTYGRTWSPSTVTTDTLANLMGANRAYYPTSLYDGAGAIHVAPGYTWGVTDPKQVRSISGTSGKDLVQQAKLFWMISQDHQLEINSTRDEFGPNFDNQAGVIDDVSNRTQKSLRTLQGLNYRGIIGGGLLDVKVGRAKKEINFASGPGDPVFVRGWSDKTSSILGPILSSNFGATTQYLTNGDYSNPNGELRQNDTVGINYNWTNSIHTVDVGAERLTEKGRLYEAGGPNRRAFYAPGRAANGQYVVYNWAKSMYAQPGELPASLYNALTQVGAGYVPEMLTYADSGSNLTTTDSTTSFYINEGWVLNQHWQVMGGLRYDNWKVENRLGTEVNTKDVSPRFEVKYDLDGDSRRLISLSYAHLRGTIGAGNLLLYRRTAGNLIQRSFWNEGDETVRTVDAATFFNAANYSAFRTENTDAGRVINPDLKPELTRQIELTYRHSFQEGGSFRMSGVYRRVSDLWYRHGVNELVDDGGRGTIKNILDIDPYNTRYYRGLELEWNLPLYKGFASRVDLNGFWTMARSKGRVTWGESQGTTAIRFDEEYQKAGYKLDDYDSFGEYAQGVHNDLKMWITWSYGARNGARSSLSLVGEYSSGAPMSFSYSEYLPGTSTGDTRSMILLASKDTPTSLSHFLAHRGAFTKPDVYYVDLKWNLTIPVYKQVSLFTELTVGNIFNHMLPNDLNLAADGTIRGKGGAAIDPTFRVANSAESLSSFGLTPAGNWVYGRNYSLSCGVRF